MVEKHLLEQARFQELVHDLYVYNYNTFIEKNKKYGDSFTKSLDKYGVVASEVRLSDKYNRMDTLLSLNDSGEDTDESVRDTMLDMANYLIMTVAWLDKKQEELEVNSETE